MQNYKKVVRKYDLHYNIHIKPFGSSKILLIIDSDFNREMQSQTDRILLTCEGNLNSSLFKYGILIENL